MRRNNSAVHFCPQMLVLESIFPLLVNCSAFVGSTTEMKLELEHCNNNHRQKEYSF